MELSTPIKNRIQLSHLENSPVFDYISNLSPLDLVKPSSISDPSAYNSLPLASPQVFASPPICSQLRDRAIDPLKLEDESFRGPNDGKLGTKSPHRVSIEPSLSLSESNEKSIRSGLCERSLVYEKGLRNFGRSDCTEDDVAHGGWESMVTQVADYLSFDASVFEDSPVEKKLSDPIMASFVSDVLQIPHGSDLSLLNDLSSVIQSSVSRGTELVQSFKSDDPVEPDLTSNIHSHIATYKGNPEDFSDMDLKGKKTFKINLCQQNVRRRCLVFEMVGTHRKISSKSYSILSSPHTEDSSNDENPMYPRTTGSSSKQTMFAGRGIGLHLNALAATSRSGKENMNPASEDSATSEVEEKLNGNPEESGFGSPNKKRLKAENGAACKRCNCRRSKCLKLYCECFAAGLYCIEPCSCQDCFNTPAHEGTVLETRSQIESRNPLAFAPKVIQSANSSSDLGEEPNHTPSSARHKRGCKCKKSNCLKKYCECFQEGVGCSSNCRCDGCKNSFGIKKAYESEFDEQEASLHRKELPNSPESSRSPTQVPARIESSVPLPTGEIKIAKFRQPKFETNLDTIPENERATSEADAGGEEGGFGPLLIRSNSRKFILRSIPSA